MKTNYIKDLITLTSEKDYQTTEVIKRYLNISDGYELKVISNYFDMDPETQVPEPIILAALEVQYEYRLEAALEIYQNISNIYEKDEFLLYKKLIQRAKAMDSNGWAIKTQAIQKFQVHFIDLIKKIDYYGVGEEHPELLI